MTARGQMRASKSGGSRNLYRLLFGEKSGQLVHYEIREVSLKRSLLIAASLVCAGNASADTLRLSDVSDADRVAIQRGYSIATGSCVLNIIDEIEAYGGKEAMREFTITFEDAPAIITNGQIIHTCDDGVHTWTENGESIIVQRYDEDGQPTMMEP